MSELQLAVIDVKPGAALESQSGLQMLRPRIYGAYREPAGPKKVAAIVMHPTSNFMGHYLIAPLAERGICCLGLNSRYMGNDTVLLMERAIQDLGAGVQFLRAAGLREGGADRQLGRRRAGELLPGAGRAAHGAPLRRRRPDAPAPGRPAAGRRHRAVRRAPGPLEADARLDRPLGHRRARPARRSTPRSTCTTRATACPTAPSSWRASAPRRGARLDRLEQLGAGAPARSCAARPARRATRPSSSTARMPIRAASTCRSTATTARRAASGAMRGRSTTRPTRWAAPPRSPPSSRSGRRARRPTGPSNLARTTVPLAAADLHRRPVDLSEHARRLAGGRRRAHPQRRHRRRQPLPGGPAAAGAAGGGRHRRNGRTRYEPEMTASSFAPEYELPQLALRAAARTGQRQPSLAIRS